MRFARIINQRLRSLFRATRVETDLHRELDLHLEQLEKQYLAAGMSPADARAAARRDFGSVDSAKEQCRDVRRVGLVEDLLRDLAYAGRVFLR